MSFPDQYVIDLTVSDADGQPLVKVYYASHNDRQIISYFSKAALNGNPSPVHYGGGVIYTVQHQHKFRCLRVGDRYSEKAVTWGHSRPKLAAWKECIAAIDQKNTKAE